MSLLTQILGPPRERTPAVSVSLDFVLNFALAFTVDPNRFQDTGGGAGGVED